MIISSCKKLSEHPDRLRLAFNLAISTQVNKPKKTPLKADPSHYPTLKTKPVIFRLVTHIVPPDYNIFGWFFSCLISLVLLAVGFESCGGLGVV
jgi:hypothetical protein